jgi:hypothetical protein
MALHAKGAQTLTIASGQTVSSTYNNRAGSALGLVMPAAFTGTTLTFKVSTDNTTFQSLYDTTNTLVSLTVAASRSYQLPAALATWPYIQVVSGSSEGASRSLVVVASI